jgi:uncharacterized membrane protein YgdD (TMEM256/DUF423 family)
MPAASTRQHFLIASSLGCSGVIFGALGAHALKMRLTVAGMASAWETAVQFQLLHAVAYLAIACALGSTGSFANSKWLGRAAAGWFLGVVFFSGSLYALALGGPRWLGPITPLGGVSLIWGWICVAVAGIKPEPKK